MARIFARLTTSCLAVSLAIYPGTVHSEQPARTTEPRSLVSLSSKETLEHWAFQFPRRHRVKSLRDITWCRQPLDTFVLRQLHAEGLSPSGEASGRVLVRRLYFTLIGLPPTPEDVQAFLADDSPDPVGKLVDRLLASPQFGEHWASFWLRLARYGENQAHNNDGKLSLPNAYRYRDWVIGAFNREIGYDQFVRLQLAADKMESVGDGELAALGFLGLGARYYERNKLHVMAEEWADQVDTVTRTFLGLTVACARCHDHKSDPIAARDYYAFAGIFASTEFSDADGHHIVKDGAPRNLPVFSRGDVTQLGDEVERGVPFLRRTPAEAVHVEGSGRLELARSLTAPQSNPLTARVFVNRVWAECMGQPLVATPSNLGFEGSLPSHPELLDDLAFRFVEQDWSIKRLIRELVLSATYRQTSATHTRGSRIDPHNRWLWRAHRRRVDITEWRDTIMSAAGTLSLRQGGASAELGSENNDRRTVYGTVKRSDLTSVLKLFDYPDPNVHSPRGAQTTTPLQKLFLLNNAFMEHQATAFARRVTRLATSDLSRTKWAYNLLYGRDPNAEELAATRLFLDEYRGTMHAGTEWKLLCHTLFCTNEILFLD